MNTPNPKHGITGPVSIKESTQEAIRSAEIMELLLRNSNFFESEDEGQTRERVLGRLDFLIKRFVEKTAPDATHKYGGKIFTFGSYRLGVHDRGADIDVLCVVPRHVSRRDFFTIFYEDLRLDEHASEISKVEDAYVPLISLVFHGIPIDLTFARLNMSIIPENISLLNDAILKSMDEKCILSLNGSRVTDAILRLVPRVDVFHSTLRAVKFWAKRRFVYGNAYGYFGGVSFSICVARVAQMYPNLCSYDLLVKFFETFAFWKWPTPILLCPVIDHNYNLKVWDPKIYPADKYHKMPVITPVYPSMNSTYNVSQSTFSLINAEFMRAHEFLKGGMNREEIEEKSLAVLSKVLEMSDFFKKHRMFIEVKIGAESREDLNSWEGYIKSKIRVLGVKLEGMENIAAATPFPKEFEEEEEVMFYIAVDVQAVKGKKIFVGEAISEFVGFVNQWEEKKEGMRIEIVSKKRKEVLEMECIKRVGFV